MWFVVAGLGMIAPVIASMLPRPFDDSGSIVAFYAPMMLGTIVSSGAVVVGSVAAYVILTRAGFPHRSRPMAFVTIGLAVGSPVTALGGFVFPFASDRWTVIDLATVIGGALLLVFAISAARNRVLPLGFRIVPAVQFVLAVLAFPVSHATFFPVNGVAYLAVGTAYIVFASHAREALEAAAAATPDERRGRRTAATPSPALPPR
jgi:hypothetical protein